MRHAEDAVHERNSYKWLKNNAALQNSWS